MTRTIHFGAIEEMVREFCEFGGKETKRDGSRNQIAFRAMLENAKEGWCEEGGESAGQEEVNAMVGKGS